MFTEKERQVVGGKRKEENKAYLKVVGFFRIQDFLFGQCGVQSSFLLRLRIERLELEGLFSEKPLLSDLHGGCSLIFIWMFKT